MKIQSKVKALQRTQHYALIFQMLKAANSKVGDGILQKSKPIRAFMVGLVTCKNVENPSKNEGTRVVTNFSHYKSIFLDAQGQLTHKSLVRSCRISNPFQIVCLSSLPARLKKNQSKMKELEWSQDFPHYNPMGAICCHENQSSDPILSKTQCSQSPSQLMLQMKFDLDRTAGLRDNNA